VKTFDVELVRRRIHLLPSEYSASLPRKAKTIPGAAFTGKKIWTFPLDWPTCVALRKTFGDALRIGPDLEEWAFEESARREAAREAAESTGLVALPAVFEQAPELNAAMENREYQTVGAAFVARVRQGVISDQPGMGKTLETIGGVIESGIVGPILVLCPLVAVQAVWEKEIRKWVPDDLCFPITGTKPKRHHALGEGLFNAGMHDTRRTWIICNMEMVRAKLDDEPLYPELFDQPWSAIICDESQRALICPSANKKKMTQVRLGIAILPIYNDTLKIALSGTPWRGRPENFWGTLNWLYPKKYSSYWRWVERYFEVVEGHFGREIADVRPDMEQEFDDELRTVMLRRTKAECLKDLPEKIYPGEDESGIWMEMDPAQAKSYRAMAEHAVTQFGKGELMASGVLAEITRLRQLATTGGEVRVDRKSNRHGNVISEKADFRPCLPSNKFDWCLNKMEELGIVGERYGDAKIVIASEFTSTLEVFREAFEAKGIDCAMITGKVTGAKRADAIERFQGEGGPRVFLINKAAGGVSITLDAADDLVMLERSGNPDVDEQMEDRVHRASRIHQVMIWYLGSKGTIEEQITDQNLTLDQVQRMLLDGNRGVDLARKLIEV
jgi:SNF2 family DNA or RNA helicase